MSIYDYYQTLMYIHTYIQYCFTQDHCSHMYTFHTRSLHTCEASPGSIGEKDGPALLSHITQQHAGLEAVGRAQHVLMAALSQLSVVIPLQLPQRHLRKASQQVVLLGRQSDGRHVCQAAAIRIKLASALEGEPQQCTVKFATAPKILAKRVLKYCRISWCNVAKHLRAT